MIAFPGVDPDMLERALECGAMLALEKPLKPKQIQDAVEELLREDRPTGGWDDAPTI
jgi:FixJ family two-component response regulator